MTTTIETPATRPAYRAPWHNGAHAYDEADNFQAATTAFKRRRKNVMFHMTNDGEAGDVKCAVCGILLREIGDGAKKEDLHSTWTYFAKAKKVGNGMHYACSWSALLTQIASIKLYG